MDFKTTPFEQFFNTVKIDLMKNGLTGSHVTKEAVALWTIMSAEERQCYANISSNMNAIKNMKKQQKSTESLNKAAMVSHDSIHSQSKPIHYVYSTSEWNLNLKIKKEYPNFDSCIKSKQDNKIENKKELRRPLLHKPTYDSDSILDSKYENTKNNSLYINKFQTNTKAECTIDLQHTSFLKYKSDYQGTTSENESVNSHSHKIDYNMNSESINYKLTPKCEAVFKSKMKDIERFSSNKFNSSTSKKVVELKCPLYMPKVKEATLDFKPKVLEENNFSLGKRKLDEANKNVHHLDNANLTEFKFTSNKYIILNPPTKNTKVESNNKNCLHTRFSKINPFPVISKPELDNNNDFLTEQSLSVKETESNFGNHLIDPNIVHGKHMFNDLMVQWRKLDDYKFNFILNPNSAADSKSKNFDLTSKSENSSRKFTLRKSKLEAVTKRANIGESNNVQNNSINIKECRYDQTSSELNFAVKIRKCSQKNCDSVKSSSFVTSTDSNDDGKKDCYDFKSLKQMLDSFEFDKKCETIKTKQISCKRRRRRKSYKSKSSIVSMNERMMKIKIEESRNVELIKTEQNNNSTFSVSV